ncbi:ABC transporter ATP-binding protein [Desulfosudis oleivorans]|uniref:ABC transporter-related protein n=1 Tax=Desulfosudis oleivorans (strain DSM 6200 / JCM 39069 / Hxd3) TaxID=96561 RepID=A8ZTT3_DESOH|nr:ABC transporter ATP-binding protein [Desulfosudis oleivorans]ABW67866.1 ABC transporter-related protein [Desulfosudis oleivorans Hxd3]
MIHAIAIDHLFCGYTDQPVLQEISFSVDPGSFFVIIGPNGSGKTTLLKAMARLLAADARRFDILGRPAGNYTFRSLAQTMAFVPQETRIDFPLTVEEFVLAGRSPYQGVLGIPDAADTEIARQAMVFTGIEHLSSRKLDQLSGGERQRAFIAKAVCQEPRLIMLDEPTASLDLAHQTRIMDLMERLKNEKGVTIVMVSHDINLAAMYGDTLLLLKEGRVVGKGAPGEILTYQVLEEAYGCVLLVDENPLGKFPRVTPVPDRLKIIH